MLVIDRDKHESFFIGNDVEIKVLDIRGKVVRLGITAPREVKIMRTELLAKLQEAELLTKQTEMIGENDGGCK